MVQTTQQTDRAIGYLQKMVFIVEKLESLKILEWKGRLYKENKPHVVTLMSGEIQSKRGCQG